MPQQTATSHRCVGTPSVHAGQVMRDLRSCQMVDLCMAAAQRRCLSSVCMLHRASIHSLWQTVWQMTLTTTMCSARRRQNSTRCCSHSRRRSLDQSLSCHLWHQTPPLSTQVLTHLAGTVRVDTDVPIEQS